MAFNYPTTMAAFHLPYHSNGWRQQQFSGGHSSEVSNVDQHVAHRNQGDPNENGERQIPKSN